MTSKTSSQKKYDSTLKLVNKVYGVLPRFTDVFDEETWYIFVVFFVLATILVAFLLSRCIKLKSYEF